MRTFGDVETTSGHLITRSGESATAPLGVLMQLHTYGPDTVRALVLVLHDSDQPWVEDVQPSGSFRSLQELTRAALTGA
jgi:hypothetical protein